MIEFQEIEHWRFHPDSFQVRFRAWDGDREILCKVERRGLDINCGKPSGDRGRLEAARKNAQKIKLMAERRIKTGKFEEDGSILIRHEDWQFV